MIPNVSGQGFRQEFEYQHMNIVFAYGAREPVISRLSVGLLFLLQLSSIICLQVAEAKDVQFHGIDIPDQSGQAMTVLGPINPELLGDTLMHEHLFIDYWVPIDQRDRWLSLNTKHIPTTKDEIEFWSAPFKVKNTSRILSSPFFYYKDSFSLQNVDEMVHEVRAYQAYGGRTIVDVTTVGLNRQPSKLQQVARKTGANIVMGTGFYRRAFYPEDMATRTQLQLTQQMVREITTGIGDTGVKAGIIGEIPAEDLTVSPEDSIEVRVLRASARASRLTGSAISLHILDTPHEKWGDVLDIMEEEGADLTRVVIGHVANFNQSLDLAFFESHLKRGVSLQFDFLGHPWARLYQLNDIQTIEMLIKHGYSKQLLVSHDVFSKLHLTKNGGDGFTFVHSILMPYLRQQGVSENDINNIIETNPRRLLTFVEPRNL